MSMDNQTTNHVFINPDVAFEMQTDNEYWIKRIIEDAQKHPDEIEILLMPEQNHGCIKVKIPYKYMEIRPDQIRLPQEAEDGRA